MDGDFKARWTPFAGFAGIARRHYDELSRLKRDLPAEPPYVPPDDGDDDARQAYDGWAWDTRASRDRMAIAQSSRS